MEDDLNYKEIGRQPQFLDKLKIPACFPAFLGKFLGKMKMN